MVIQNCIRLCLSQNYIKCYHRRKAKIKSKRFLSLKIIALFSDVYNYYCNYYFSCFFDFSFRIKLNVLLHLLYHAKACNEFLGPIFVSLLPGRTASFEKNVLVLGISYWTSNLPLQRRTCYRLTNSWTIVGCMKLRFSAMDVHWLVWVTSLQKIFFRYEEFWERLRQGS